jgi:hypothetical protein
MPTRPKRSRDPVKAAHQVYLEIIGEAPESVPEQEKNPTTVKRARRAGSVGGPARAAKLTAEQRSEIARIAAEARWKKSES